VFVAQDWWYILEQNITMHCYWWRNVNVTTFSRWCKNISYITTCFSLWVYCNRYTGCL